MNILHETYKKIFNHGPENLSNWQIAEQLLDNFSVPSIGEVDARKVLLEIINHVQFPDQETRRRVVLRAENLSTEIFDEFNKPNKEPHMAEFEHLENREKTK